MTAKRKREVLRGEMNPDVKLPVDVDELQRLLEIRALLRVAADSRGSIKKRLIKRAIQLALES